MTIGEKIYEMRAARSMSLREFANVTGLTHTTIARLESQTVGPQKIFLDTVYQICKKLNYDFGKFLIETGYLKGGIQATSGDSPEERKLVDSYRELNQSGKRLVNETIKTLLTTAGGSGQNKNNGAL